MLVGLSSVPRRAVLYLLKLVVPEQLPCAIIKHHVEGSVLWATPPTRDRSLTTVEMGFVGRSSHPHPLANLRFLGPHARPLFVCPQNLYERASRPATGGPMLNATPFGVCSRSTTQPS